MFSKLKDKLKNWTKKISKDLEKSKEEENIVKEATEKKEAEKKSKKEAEKEEAEEISKDIKEEENLENKKNLQKEKNKFLKKIKTRVQGKIKISEKDFEKYLDDFELLLIENNVAIEVVDKIIQELKNKLLDKEILKKEFEDEITKSLKEIIENILIEPFDFTKDIKNKSPYVILFCGINGTGKTTTIAKIANYLKSKNISCVLAAADTFRAASIEQIKKHGENLNVKVIANKYGSDPASVGFDAINYAKRHKTDCVLIDTAGRMHTDKNLLKEIEKISRVCKPNLKIFVGESITGNDSIEQIKKFDESINIDAIILSKADIDEKGGTALSLGYITKKPILFLGTGQNYNDLELFNKKEFIKKLGLKD